MSSLEAEKSPIYLPPERLFSFSEHPTAPAKYKEAVESEVFFKKFLLPIFFIKWVFVNMIRFLKVKKTDTMPGDF